MNVQVQGDILVLCKNAPSNDLIFRFSFHTSFALDSDTPGVFRLSKADVDIEKRDVNANRLPDDFALDVQVGRGDDSVSCACRLFV